MGTEHPVADAEWSRCAVFSVFEVRRRAAARYDLAEPPFPAEGAPIPEGVPPDVLREAAAFADGRAASRVTHPVFSAEIGAWQLEDLAAEHGWAWAGHHLRRIARDREFEAEVLERRERVAWIRSQAWRDPRDGARVLAHEQGEPWPPEGEAGGPEEELEA